MCALACSHTDMRDRLNWDHIETISSDRQNNEHIRENRTKNRTNIRQNRILQNNPNIFFFILLELYWIIRPSIFVLILQNNQTELHSWCLWMCFKNIKCYPQQQLGTLISMFTVHWILQNYYILKGGQKKCPVFFDRLFRQDSNVDILETVCSNDLKF